MSRFLIALLAAAAAGAAYRDGPPPAHTGAFGEPDCGACHFDAARDDAEGEVDLQAPDRYRPGRAYDLEVGIRRPGIAAGGFQLSARFADGPEAGGPAGTLEPLTPRTGIRREGGVAYASHTADGVSAEQAGEIRWAVRWTAPCRARGPVAFDVAAQAANDDDSEFGERLYTTRRVAGPVRADRTPPAALRDRSTPDAPLSTTPGEEHP